MTWRNHQQQFLSELFSPGRSHYTICLLLTAISFSCSLLSSRQFCFTHVCSLFTAISFSSLLARYIHSVVFNHVGFFVAVHSYLFEFPRSLLLTGQFVLSMYVHFTLSSLSLAHHCGQDIPSMFVCLLFTTIFFSFSSLLLRFLNFAVFHPYLFVCLFRVSCYLFLFLIIVSKMYLLSCVSSMFVVHCYLFLLLIIVGKISSLSCVQP